jgi:hypothetical protein
MYVHAMVFQIFILHKFRILRKRWNKFLSVFNNFPDAAEIMSESETEKK